MTIELGQVADLKLTAFHGGAARGPCLQLTVMSENDVSRLTMVEAGELADRINGWVHHELELALARSRQGGGSPS